MLTLKEAPFVKADMLIRRPVAEVFEAFVDPAITTKFWFTKSTGRLETGKRVRWDWEMYGVFADVDVEAVEPNRRIRIEWGSDGDMTEVEWTFTPRTGDETFVTVTNTGFKGDGDSIVGQVIDSTGGFTMVLCALKALLEHNVVLTVVADKAPDAHVTR
ncbi:SRPBCC family protein [Paenibacillus sp. GYB003]|uniref:SRPBCC family protein n=1 Tax=Paenibacillus sp. GYB003 TaxID=2994392 RepID=UPI002F9683A2